MPRHARLDFEGGFYHLINRGIERRPIFSDEADRLYFRDTLAKLLQEEKHLCYGWVLMPNHFHLLMERGRTPLSRFMSRLSTSYAGYFNRKHHRAGRLFQNRYKAILCDKDAYFKELLAYIHLNPLRAQIVKTPDELVKYRWSGHRALLGKEEQHWLAADQVLEMFGRKEGDARENYMRYLCERKNKKVDFSGGGLIRSAGGLQVVEGRKRNEREEYDSRVLGDGAFVRSVLGNKEEDRSGKNHEKDFWNGVKIEELIRLVGGVFGVRDGEVRQKGKSARKVRNTRAVVSYLAVEHKGEKKMDLAELFCIQPPAISKLFAAGQQMMAEDRDLRDKILGVIRENIVK